MSNLATDFRNYFWCREVILAYRCFNVPCNIEFILLFVRYNIWYITYEMNTFNDTLNFNEILETSIFVLTVCRIEFQIAFEWNQIRSIKSFQTFITKSSTGVGTFHYNFLLAWGHKLTCCALKYDQNVLMRGFTRTDILVWFERVILWDHSCSYWSKVAV